MLRFTRHVRPDSGMKRTEMILRITAFVLAASALGLPAEVSAAKHTKDSLKTVREKLDAKEAILIDVREQSEWDDGHLQEAALVPLSQLRKNADSPDIRKKLSKDKIIYCHCRSGGRVLRAADILTKKGYDIRPLKQGYDELRKAGFRKATNKNQ